MPDALQQIDDVAHRADAELNAVKNAAELEQFRIKYLGAKGEIKALMKLLGQVPREQKPAMGQKVNAVQDQVNAAFEALKTEFSAGGDDRDAADVTEPGRKPEIGNRH